MDPGVAGVAIGVGIGEEVKWVCRGELRYISRPPVGYPGPDPPHHWVVKDHGARLDLAVLQLVELDGSTLRRKPGEVLARGGRTARALSLGVPPAAALAAQTISLAASAVGPEAQDMFSPALRAWVERSFAQCTRDNERTVVEREFLNRVAQGGLEQVDWDTEPLVDTSAAPSGGEAATHATQFWRRPAPTPVETDATRAISALWSSSTTPKSSRGAGRTRWCRRLDAPRSSSRTSR